MIFYLSNKWQIDDFMKIGIVKIEPDKIDPYTELQLYLSAALAEGDSGLLRAESSQAQFNATRVYLHGRREALVATQDYLDGKSGSLDALTRP